MRGGPRRAAPSKIRGGRPAARPAGVVQRPSRQPAVRRGTNPRATTVRTIRKQAVRSQASKINNRPRPVVRPAARPAARMPKAIKARPQPTAAPRAAVRPMPGIKGRRAVRPSARDLKRGKVATMVAGAAAAGAFVALNRASVHPELMSSVSSIDLSLQDLQEDVNFVDIQADVANLDANLNHAINLLESARDKGYKYQADLEDIAYEAMSRWQEVSGSIDGKIAEQSKQLQRHFGGVNRGIEDLNKVISTAAGAGAVSKLQTEINRFQSDVRQSSNAIESIYSDIEAKASELTRRLTAIHWALSQRDEASFEFEKDEDLYQAVTARWDQEGKDDPEGVLFLTNKRFIFERKEKVATKKVLFVTTASELVQEAMIVKDLDKVKEVKARNKGVFGGKDFIDVKYDDQMVSYELIHQDNKDWVNYLKDAKSGAIEKDRTSGTGLSFSDLTGDVTSADIMEIQNEVNELQDEMMLKDLKEELGSLETEVKNLDRELAALRNRGYVIEKSLEADVQILAAQWEQIKERSNATIEAQTKLLSEQMKAIQANMAALAAKSGNLKAARPDYIALKSSIASAEAQAEAAEETVLNQYDDYADEIETLDSHFEWIDWMMDAVETASFQLLATESGVAGVEAVWERPGLEPENGILFLTDQRLLWEDRVDDYELKIDVAMDNVENVKFEEDETTGQHNLVIGFAPGAPVSKAVFSLAMPVGEEWVQMLGRAKSDGYSVDRAVELKAEDIERVKNAPTQCTNCGGSFTAPILRGQTDIVCEFCGVSTRI